MEVNVCDINHLDADVLLPPRKRLLAGLKKQNSDVYSTPSPPTVSSPGSEFDIRLNNLLKSHCGESNRSNEEIVEDARLAAVEAVKFAKAARATAEDKAARAAKAVAAAKSALELVATLSDEAASKDKHLKRNNKMKKHVAVQVLYNKNKGTENCRTDEELARTLHRAINSSPRISKSSTSDSGNHKHKRLKRSSPSEKTKLQNEITSWEGSRPSMSNGNGIAREKGLDALISEKDLVRIDLNTSKFNKFDHTKMVNGEASQPSKSDYVNTENKQRESIISKEKLADSSDAKKKGRLKQKKLPLSICSFRDQANPKEGLKSKSSLPLDGHISKGTTSNNPIFPLERTSMWKCQAFKAPTCVEQNKVMQS